MPNIFFLNDLLVILLAAIFVVAIFRRLNLSPVLGYFVAGSMIGSHALNIVQAHDLEIFAEFGVVFLLFAIGLELTFERLKSMRSQVFGFGTMQVVLTMAAAAWGLSFFTSTTQAAIVIGGGLALSSTAVVLQVIAENRTQSTQVGRLALATLILQDFAVVPLLVLVPLLAKKQGHIFVAVSGAFGKAMIALIIIFVAGRLMLRPLYRMIASENAAKTNELFVATTLLIALGAAWTTENLGLSLALGAFVAGVLVAETEFQHQAEESISPFKGLFLGLFFMTVGMEINIRMIIDNIMTVALLSLSLIALKASIITLLCLLFRFSLGAAVHAGLLLSQGGEFAFVLFRIAGEQNIIASETEQMLLLVVTMTMALTPLLSKVGDMVADKLDKKEKMREQDVNREVADMDNHVIIAGFGRVGKMVAKLLEAEHVRYVAVDINHDLVADARDEGFPVYRGDASQMLMLKTLGIERASCIIFTLDNEVTMKKGVRSIHNEFPNLAVIVRSQDLANAGKLRDLGVSIVVPETYETGLQLGGAVLKTVGISEFEVSRIKNHFRAGNYILAKNINDDFMDEKLAEEIATTLK